MIPLDAKPNEADQQKAEAIMRGGLGKAELEVVASYTVPFLWTLRESSGQYKFKGGTAFFLDAGEKIIAVTASHVVDECLGDSRSSSFGGCTLGSENGMPVAFRLEDRLIDRHPVIDIATFHVTPEEIQQTGREILKGYYHPNWPPPLPQKDRGVTFCGFPGIGRHWLSSKEIALGRIAFSGVATNCHELAISVQIERENLFRVLGNEPLSENYNFGGISGGPVIAIIQTPTIRSWMPAGVVIQGPNPSGLVGESISGLEIIRARPVHFIKSNGELDVTRWEQSN